MHMCVQTFSQNILTLDTFFPQDSDSDDPPCNCSQRFSIEYLAEGRYRLGEKILFIRVRLARWIDSCLFKNSV